MAGYGDYLPCDGCGLTRLTLIDRRRALTVRSGADPITGRSAGRPERRIGHQASQAAGKNASRAPSVKLWVIAGTH